MATLLASLSSVMLCCNQLLGQFRRGFELMSSIQVWYYSRGALSKKNKRGWLKNRSVLSSGSRGGGWLKKAGNIESLPSGRFIGIEGRDAACDPTFSSRGVGAL